MRAGEAVARTGATVRALRYYEACGLVVPGRTVNGYRDYSEFDVVLVQEIRALTALGLKVGQTEPFLACLRLGHQHSDDCPSSLVAYRAGIAALDELIEPLIAKRAALAAQLEAAARRGMSAAEAPPAVQVPPWVQVAPDRLLPDQAEEPDSVVVERLLGRRVPGLRLESTAGERVVLDALAGLTVIYLYPLTGRPGVDLPEGWDGIPGARGCTPEACGFRDHHDKLRDAGAAAVFGLSSQSTPYQREVSDRLRLPFAMLSDPRLRLARALGLPTFPAAGAVLYRRLTLIVRDGIIEHVFYPVAAPDRHAEQVLRWLESGPARQVDAGLASGA